MKLIGKVTGMYKSKKMLNIISLLAMLFVCAMMPAWAQQPAETTPPAATAQPAPPADTTQPATTAPPADTTQPATGPTGNNTNSIWETVQTGNTNATGGTGTTPFNLPDKGLNPDELTVTIAFSKADLTNVLSFLSMASNVPIVLDADVKGTVTIISVKKVTLTTAYEVINSALRVRGYTMIGTLKDKLIRVVPLTKAISNVTPVRLPGDTTPIGIGDTMVTQVVQLQYADAVKLKDELKPLVSTDQASIVSVSGSNTLIITDSESNIHRLLQIIDLLNKDTSDILDVEVYTCQFANASTLLKSLQTIFPPQTTTGTTTTNQNRNIGGGRFQPPNATASSGATSSDLSTLKGDLRIAADDRTNSLVITATRAKIDLILKVVKKLDVNTLPDVSSKVFPLKYADATAVAAQLNTMFIQPSGSTATSANTANNRGGRNATTTPTTTSLTGSSGLKENVVIADIRSNSIIVAATAENLRAYSDMVTQLDTPTVLTDSTHTYTLKYADATVIATTLNQLFRGTGTTSTTGGAARTALTDLVAGGTASTAGSPLASLRTVTVVAEVKSNTLLVTGPPQSFSTVEKLINDLDKRALQIFIQVAIVDVTLDNSTKFGVEWKWNSENMVPGTTNPKSSSSTNFDLKAQTLGFKYSVLSNNLQALLAALETQSNVKVYSTPSITTANNVKAVISIGQDLPYVTSDNTNQNGVVTRTVDFKTVSISLTVTPHVNGTSGLISLDVIQTINELIGRDVELNSPITANRQATTTVMVQDGQTIVIGGIIKENNSRALSGVPILSKIPLIGELFKSRTNTKQKSELMVFMTPHILKDEESIDKITTDEQQKLSDPTKIEMKTKKERDDLTTVKTE